MRLRNDFTSETRELFTWNYECWWCGQNHWNAFHHIKGRSSSSPLNACPINNEVCHIGNGKLATFDVQTTLLKKTFEYLVKINYSITDDDKKFIKSNKQHYEKFLSKQTLRNI